METESGQTGYAATITTNSQYDGMATSNHYEVEVVRLSDGEKRTRIFSWRWRARKFARSPRRIAREFNRDPVRRHGEVEKYIIEWK